MDINKLGNEKIENSDKIITIKLKKRTHRKYSTSVENIMEYIDDDDIESLCKYLKSELHCNVVVKRKILTIQGDRVEYLKKYFREKLNIKDENIKTI